MRSLSCVVGRHQWQPGTDSDGRPFERCTRSSCGRYRYPDDGTRYSGPDGRPQSSPWSASGGPAAGDGGGGGDG